MTGKNKLGRSRIASAALTVLFAATLGGFAAVRAENVRAVQVATTARWQAETGRRKRYCYCKRCRDMRCPQGKPFSVIFIFYAIILAK